MTARSAFQHLFLALAIVASFALFGRPTTIFSAPGGANDNNITKEEFHDPPMSARPGAFWPWLNGSVSLERITYELEEMKKKGMSGADIWDVRALINPNGDIPAGPPFLSDDSLKAIGHAIREAGRLGLRLGMIAASGWNAGGPWVKPPDAGIGLFSSRISVKGPNLFSKELPFPAIPPGCPKDAAGHPVYSREVAVLAFPQEQSGQTITSTEQVIDLHKKLDKDGRLTWKVPKGEWTILRFVSMNTGYQLIVPSPNSEGPMIDFLNPGATRRHFQHIVDRLNSEVGDVSKCSLKYLEVDSMELGNYTAWTGCVLKKFIEQHHYDPLAYLPVLQGWRLKDKDVAQRFLYDWRRTVSDLFIESHYRAGRKLLNQYGLKLCAEAGGPGAPIWASCPVDALKALGAVDILRGEFWPKHRNIRLVKEIACAAHIYGKKIVDAESFTSWRHWQDGPYFDKQLADNAFGEGLNHLTFHTFSHSPAEAGLPGREYHAGTHINPNCAWWPMAGPFIDYLSRCSYLLQKGLFVADVCFYYGGQAPNFVPPKHVKFSPGEGYDYDVTNSDVILNRMAVKDKRIILPNGMSYAVLVLPDRKDMDLEVLKKLESLIRAGATVIGPKPIRTKTLTGYPGCDKELENLADKIWGDCKKEYPVTERIHGRGRIIWNRSIGEVLQAAGIQKDFSYSNPDGRTRLDYIHRRAGRKDIYFVINRNERWENIECIFRVSGKKPELWHPETGRITGIPVYEDRGDRTCVPLHLGPAESFFVLFEKPAEPLHVTRLESRLKVQRPPAEKPPLLYHSATPGGPMWLSDGKSKPSGQWITFDLACPYKLKKLRIWNYDENILGLLNYGIKDMDILVSPGNTRFKKILSCSLKPGSENEDKAYYQDIQVKSGPVRYIRLDVKSNQDMPYYSYGISNFVGLSRIKFFGVKETGGVKEISGVKIQSVSSGRAFDPVSDEDLGVATPGGELLVDQSGQTFLRAWRPGTFILHYTTGHVKKIKIATVPKALKITGPWDVKFSADWGAPAGTRFEKLISWTDSRVDGIKYYSGTAVYRKQFDVEQKLLGPGYYLELDLGVVQKVAKVTLNGKLLGILWKPPFRIALSDSVHPGRNELVVAVANTWTNRLIGDAFLPADKQYCKTNLHARLSRRERQLQPSGLLGPVKIHVARNVRGITSLGKSVKKLPVAGEVFDVAGHTAFLILPTGRILKPGRPIPWVWYAPTLPGLPGIEEKWMFERFLAAGIAICGVDVGESFGNPQGRAVYSLFYKEMVKKRGLAAKACLLARSRGGLMLYNWASEHPESIACIAGIYPVCNIRSWPGIKPYLCRAYNMTKEEMSRQLAKHNPVDRLKPLANSHVPIFHIHGDSDTVVPLEKNSRELARRYRSYGGKIELVVVKKQGHNMWPGFFQCQKLVDFVIKNATAVKK